MDAVRNAMLEMHCLPSKNIQYPLSGSSKKRRQKKKYFLTPFICSLLPVIISRVYLKFILLIFILSKEAIMSQKKTRYLLEKKVGGGGGKNSNELSFFIRQNVCQKIEVILLFSKRQFKHTQCFRFFFHLKYNIEMYDLKLTIIKMDIFLRNLNVCIHKYFFPMDV